MNADADRAPVHALRPPLAGLRRLLERPPPPRPDERCELCGERVPAEHAHLVRVADRSLQCACRACYLLFTHDGAAGGRYRAVPERYLYAPDFRLGEAQWDALQIPVRMAFFFHNSALGRVVALYPSPAGATESELPLDVWDEVLGASPLCADMSPDVEALLVYRASDGYACYLAPIDACYELVGRVRLHWRGFEGGAEAWREIDDFFARLRARSRAVQSVEQHG